MVWSYPRGSDLSKDGETAIDDVTYAAQIAAHLGANIIKVKLPSAKIELPDAQKVYLNGHFYRGRNAGYLAPPAQIRTGPINKPLT